MVDDWDWGDCRYGTVNPGFTPTFSVSFCPGDNNHFVWAFRNGATTWNVYNQGGWWGWKCYYYSGSAHNTSFRFTSSAVDLPSLDKDSGTIYYWIFGYQKGEKMLVKIVAGHFYADSVEKSNEIKDLLEENGYETAYENGNFMNFTVIKEEEIEVNEDPVDPYIHEEQSNPSEEENN